MLFVIFERRRLWFLQAHSLMIAATRLLVHSLETWIWVSNVIFLLIGFFKRRTDQIIQPDQLLSTNELIKCSFSSSTLGKLSKIRLLYIEGIFYQCTKFQVLIFSNFHLIQWFTLSSYLLFLYFVKYSKKKDSDRRSWSKVTSNFNQRQKFNNLVFPKFFKDDITTGQIQKHRKLNIFLNSGGPHIIISPIFSHLHLYKKPANL